jgi:hypothetical protein
LEYPYGEGDGMQVPKAIRGIFGKIADKAKDTEFSEELTNAYFGNQEAWQITPDNSRSPHHTKKEP